MKKILVILVIALMISVLVGVTEDEIFDKLGLAIQYMLEQMAKQVEAEAGFLDRIGQK